MPRDILIEGHIPYPSRCPPSPPPPVEGLSSHLWNVTAVLDTFFLGHFLYACEVVVLFAVGLLFFSSVWPVGPEFWQKW